jgi:hypothetical protein
VEISQDSRDGQASQQQLTHQTHDRGVKPSEKQGQYKNITEGEIALPRTHPTKNNTTTPPTATHQEHHHS